MNSILYRQYSEGSVRVGLFSWDEPPHGTAGGGLKSRVPSVHVCTCGSGPSTADPKEHEAAQACW